MTIGDVRVKLARSGVTRVELRYWRDGSFDLLSVSAREARDASGPGRDDVGMLTFAVEGPMRCFTFLDGGDEDRMTRWIMERYHSYHMIKLQENKGGSSFEAVAAEALEAVAPRLYTEVAVTFLTEQSRVVRHRIRPRHSEITVTQDELRPGAREQSREASQ